MSVLRLTPEQLRAYNAKRGGWAPATTASAAPSKAHKGAKIDSGRPFPASGVRPPSKYKNKRTTGGYASVKEGKRAQELKLLEQAGEIRNGSLREQVRYELIPAQEGERPVHYVADFVYETAQLSNPDEPHSAMRWQMIVEDVKGVRTKDYIIKRKLMLWVHGIRVREV